MRFQVPQFIEVEDKIVGPLTFKQFIYLAGTAGVCIVLYSFLPLFLAIIIMIPMVVFGLALAFFQVNNKPFIRIVEAFLKYSITSNLYIWKHQPKKIIQKEEQNDVEPLQYVPKLSQSKLKDLTWSLDIAETVTPTYRGSKVFGEEKE